MKTIVIIVLSFCTSFVFAQTGNIGIGTAAPNANALLDIKSGTKGVLLPRMDSVARKAIPNTKGLMVYDTTYNSFYFNTGTAWQKMSGTSAIANGSNPGDMLYWNGNSWSLTPAGKPGQYLQFDSTSKPMWSGDQYPSLTTLPVTNISDSSATFNLKLITAGLLTPSVSYYDDFQKGVIWSTSPNPVYNDFYNGITLYDSASTPGNYSYDASSTGSALYVNTTYYVRSYAFNNGGFVYGNQVSFKTLNGTVRIPQVTTYYGGPDTDSANLSGVIPNTGGAPITAYGFLWKRESDASYSTVVSNNLSASYFSATLKNLTHNITYYFMAYATNSAGTGYGEVMNFYNP